RIDDRTRMARSPYDLRRRGDRRRRGRAVSRRSLHRPLHRLLHHADDPAPVREGEPASMKARLTGTPVRLLFAALTSLALLLASPAGAFALEVNEDFKPQNEFKLDPWIEIKVGGLDLSITKAVFYVIVTCILTCVTMVWIARRMQARPNRVQTAVEAAYTLMKDNITGGNMSEAMAK